MPPSSPDDSATASDAPGDAVTADGTNKTGAPVFQAGWREVLIGLVGSWVLRLLAATLRFRSENLDVSHRRTPGESFIFAFWHNRLLLIPVVWERFLQPPGAPGGKGLTSTSRDGELIAQFLARFGVGPVRGSATRRGSTALRELVRWLRKGHDVGITPDGSRGPRYEVKPGLVLLAQLSGRRIVPLSFEYTSAWRTKSWDRFYIPKPFSRVTFVVGEPFAVQRTATPEEFEAERQRCEAAMRATIRDDDLTAR